MKYKLAGDKRGVASIEFALAATVIITAALNAADIGSYVYQSMQVENAAQMGVQAAVQLCTPAQIPVTTSCPKLKDGLLAAIAATSLGNAVVIDAGQPVESYFCVDGSDRLVEVGTIDARPATCSAAGNPASVPGDYILVTVSYDFIPLMQGAGIALLLDTPIRRTAIMRVG